MTYIEYFQAFYSQISPLIPANAQVLEVGIGTGIGGDSIPGVEILPFLQKEYQITAIDISPEAKDAFKKTYGDYCFQILRSPFGVFPKLKVDFKLGDPEGDIRYFISDKNNRYELIFFGNVLHFIPPEQREELFNHIYNSLKSPGYAYISVFHDKAPMIIERGVKISENIYCNETKTECFYLFTEEDFKGLISRFKICTRFSEFNTFSDKNQFIVVLAK
jgi:SAM-dependent methyltransferase